MHALARNLAALALLGAAACSESPISLPEPATISLLGGDVTLAVGDQATVAAQVLDQQGRVMRAHQPAFTSSSPSVASVDASGTVRAVTPGEARITATYGSLTESVTVTVTPNDRAQVRALRLAADSLVVDTRAGAQPLAVVATNGLGQFACPQLSFRSSDRAVATARPAGECRMEVVPSFPGETTIVVQAGEAADTLRVRVTNVGAVAFFSARPAAEALLAGATTAYTVRVIDQSGAPLAGTRVHFSTSVGQLSSTTVVTDAGGRAAVQWQIPTHLRELGQTQSISFRTQLPNGVVTGATEYVFVNGATLAEIVLYYAPGYGSTNLQPVTGPLQLAPYTYHTLGASGVDQYGNIRVEDFTFSLGQNGWISNPNGAAAPSGIRYTALYGYPGAAVFTARTASGETRTLQITFQ